MNVSNQYSKLSQELSRKMQLTGQKMFYLVVIICLMIIYTIRLKSSTANSSEHKMRDVPIVTATEQKSESKTENCYQFPMESTETILPDILNAKIKPDKGRSIFFLITTCSQNGIVTLSTSQACAIESAAYHNPNRSIFVLFTSPVGLHTDSQTKTLDVLRSYKNIHFLNVDMETFVEGTQVEDFYRSGRLFTSIFLVEHMSDFLRLLVLYKYGGIYLDTDVIVQKNMNQLPANFIGREAYFGGTIIDSVNNAVIGFQDDIGHEILELCLKELTINFDPNAWDYNGPKLLTRILMNSVCHTRLSEMTPDKCNGFMVFPTKEFHPINWDEWSQFANESYTGYVLEAAKNSSTVHLYKHCWRYQMVTKSKRKTAYQVIAEKNCPNVFQASGKYI